MQIRYGQEQVDRVVRDQVAPLLKAGTIVTFTGNLGAGKTTLVRAALRQLGVDGAITSPTFTYVNTYAVGDLTIHHFDLYRLSSADEFCQAGFEEYLTQPNAVVLIEWAAVIEQVLARHERVHRLVLDYDQDDIEVRILSKFSGD